MKMPSKKKELKQTMEIVSLALMIDSDSDSDLETDLSYLNHKAQQRYLCPRTPNIRHDPRYILAILQMLPAPSFCQLFRTSLTCFHNLYDLIKSHPIFHNTSFNPQRDPSIQLAVALCRLGSNGNGAAACRLQNLFSLGYGTINLYTRRVIIAIISMQSSLLTWPSKEERLEYSQVMQAEGFPGCIGFVDGTTIPLSQKPALDGNHYFDRKKRYSISVQLICDINKKFISFHAGYPGSCHDSYVFQRMEISRNPGRYFDKNQYLLADSAYASGQYVLPAFRGPALERKCNSDFNYHLAQSRVRIEHAIGILKGRFSSLRELRTQLRSKEEMKDSIDWIMACVILHNLLANLKDTWNELYQDEIPEPPIEIQLEESSHYHGSGIRSSIVPITLDHFN